LSKVAEEVSCISVVGPLSTSGSDGESFKVGIGWLDGLPLGEVKF
jgi:hypothetical protein